MPNEEFYDLLNKKFDNQKKFNQELCDLLKKYMDDQSGTNNGLYDMMTKLTEQQLALVKRIEYLEGRLGMSSYDVR